MSLICGGNLLLICIVRRRAVTHPSTHIGQDCIASSLIWTIAEVHLITTISCTTAGPLDRLNYVAPLHVGGLWWWLTQTNLILHQSIVWRGINNINIIYKRQVNTRFQGIVSLYLIWLIQFRLNSQICVN